MNLHRHLQAIRMEARQYRGDCYPDFVTARRTDPARLDGVVVFMLHAVQPGRFERQVRFLRDNGYRTIDCDTLLRFLRGEADLEGPSVMLTFDDGERSLYEVAFPILQRYGLRAVNFIVPGMIHASPAERPAIGKAWCTWEEVRAMHHSGVIDFQSHTLWHERMFTGETPLDFWREDLFTDGLLVDRPRVCTNGQDTLLAEWGAPLYPMAPRMMDALKFIDRDDIRRACIEHVARQGGAAFFHKDGWRAELESVWRTAKGAQPAGGFETAEEQRVAILDSLIRSRSMLEGQLQREVRHLAYPWAMGGTLARRLSEEAGYRTNFHGPITGTPLNRPGTDPYRIARIKDDFIERLPGRGRRALWSILAEKAVRRLRHRDIY
ncbi:MAG TPA: polysaccharide deacetylase family protein [Kiritimatiellia bacterium]|nr:polysaccharide deacetylase family protein [Kiritimatiellia bacterium]HMP33707.1 polysaccharide deacetylase family protein [Kiritimatiellia bacterium]